MGAGLSKRLIPIFAGGGLDTKTDPRLVPPGSLLELENMYFQRTGELRLRNGFSRIANARSQRKQIFPMLGGLGALDFSSTGGSFQRYLTVPAAGFLETGEGLANGSPATLRAEATPVGAYGGIFVTSATDLVDGDIASSSAGDVISFVDNSDLAGSKTRLLVTGDSANVAVAGGTFFPTGDNGRPPVVAVGGTTFHCAFYVDAAGPPPSLRAAVSTGGGPFTLYSLALNAVSAAQPWIDAKPIPGGNNIAVAYRATGGGVTCGIFNPSTGTFTSTVNTAGADASFCLGFLDDLLATGNMYLATAGSGSGVVVRTMSAATMVVSATHVIDAAATTGVRQISGYIVSSATDYVTVWSINGSVTIYDKTRYGTYVAGVVTLAVFIGSMSLYSKIGSIDGRYVAVFAFDSSVQPAYVVLDVSASVAAAVCPVPAALIFPGEGGGRRSVQSSLTGLTSVNGVLSCVLSKRTKATVGSSASPTRVLQKCSIVPCYPAATGTAPGMFRPRELGGTEFFPGGIISQHDGTSDWLAAFPFYPEAPTVIGTGGGAMTLLGTYSYRLILRTTDRNGRAIRSAGSVPVSVTLTGAQQSTNLTIPNPHLALRFISPSIAIEVYRSGPAAAGASVYNKVGEVNYSNSQITDFVSFNDLASDVTAATGEFPYFTGNVLENFCPPSCNLMEVNGGRLGIVNSENDVEFWISKEYKAGSGIGFYPDSKIRVTGDGYGGITAVAAMDSRWILFKSSAIYVISGDGPNDSGQGSFNFPQAVSLSIGTVLPGSVVATPDGIMFQSAKGIYLLDRGLGLTYLGAQVEQYTLAANVVDAALVHGTTTVRFVFASGRCVEWDYFHKCWYTHQYRVGSSTITSCAGVASGWYYALADGTVMQETPGVYSDVMGTSTAIVPRVGFPNLNLAGLNGLQRVYGIQVEGEFVGNHTLQASAVYDLGVATEPTRSLAITAGPYQYEVRLATQKCSVMQLNLTASLAAGSGAFRLSGVSLICGFKRGTGVPYTRRLV